MLIAKNIKRVIVLAEKELDKQDYYGYLPGILELLKTMHQALLDDDFKTCDDRLTGLGRIITDDCNFSESELGDKLLNLVTEVDEFIADKL